MNINKKDICVIGMGRFGLSVLKQLIELKKQVLAIDQEEKNLIIPSRLTNTAILDGTDVEGLKALGIDKFNTVIVSAAENIEIVSSLKEIGVKHIIAKAGSETHERVLNQIGVDIIVRPEFDAGIRTALIATNSNFIKYSKFFEEIGDNYAIGSTVVNNNSWINKPLSELKFKKLDVSVVSIKRKSKIMLPRGNIKLKYNDIITLIGKIYNLTKSFNELNIIKN